MTCLLHLTSRAQVAHRAIARAAIRAEEAGGAPKLGVISA